MASATGITNNQNPKPEVKVQEPGSKHQDLKEASKVEFRVMPLMKVPRKENKPYQIREGFETMDMFPIGNMSPEDDKQATVFLKELKERDLHENWIKSPPVNVESLVRLGTHKDGYMSNEIIRYIFEGHQTLFNLPPAEKSYLLFDSFFSKKIIDLYKKHKKDQKSKDSAAKEPIDFSEVMKAYKKKMVKIGILRYHTVIFLINKEKSHWAMICFLPRYMIMEVVDSLGGKHKIVASAIWSFWDQMCQSEPLASKYNYKAWKYYYARHTIPRQKDKNNCGLFCVFFALAYIH